MEEIYVQIINTPYGVFSDALYFTPKEYNDPMREFNKERMKQERVDRWIYAIEHNGELPPQE